MYYIEHLDNGPDGPKYVGHIKVVGHQQCEWFVINDVHGRNATLQRLQGVFFHSSITYYDCDYEGRSDMIRTGAAVSANNKLLDRANYHRIVQSQHSISPPNSLCRACL